MTRPVLKWDIKLGGEFAGVKLKSYVNSILYNEELGKMSKIMLRFLNPMVKDNSKTKNILSRGREVQLFAGWQHVNWLGTGIIYETQPDLVNMQLFVNCYSKGHELGLDIRDEVYKKMKDSDIAKKIAGNYNMKPIVDETKTIHNRTQHNKTDYAYLNELATRNGYVFSVEYNYKKKSWELHFEKPKYTAQNDSKLYNIRSHNTLVKSFVPRTYGSIHKHTKLVLNCFITKEGKSITLNSMVKGPNAIETLGEHPIFETIKDAQDYLDGIADARNQVYMTATASVIGDNTFKIGEIIKWKGTKTMFFGLELDGEYRVTGYTHHINPDQSVWSTSLELTRTK